MKIALIRGTYFNKYEMQNYEPLAGKFNIVGFSGLRPIHKNYKFPLIKLFSPVDLPNFPYKMSVLNRLYFGDAMYLHGLENKLKGFDIAHVRETYFHFTIQALNAKKKGYVKKIICTCSETIPFNHEGIWNRKKFKQRAIKEVDLFHCLSQKAKICLIKEGCNPKKIEVFPYGVNLDIFKPLKKREKREKIKFLFVGRLVKEKGIFDLLKSFILIWKKYKKVELEIIGDGPEKTSLFSLISLHQNLEKAIRLKSCVPYNKIYKNYQQNDIFCLFSKSTENWEEYLGMSLIEAMASGLPVIVSNCGAIKEVVNNCGLVVPMDNWQRAFQAMEKLVLNEKLRKRLGYKARIRSIKLFNIKKISKKIAFLWKRLQ